MDKKGDPVGIRFRSSIREAIQEIALLEDKSFSEIIDRDCKKFIWDYAFDHPHLREKFTRFDSNGQENGGSTE